MNTEKKQRKKVCFNEKLFFKEFNSNGDFDRGEIKKSKSIPKIKLKELEWLGLFNRDTSKNAPIRRGLINSVSNSWNDSQKSLERKKYIQSQCGSRFDKMPYGKIETVPDKATSKTGKINFIELDLKSIGEIQSDIGKKKEWFKPHVKKLDLKNKIFKFKSKIFDSRIIPQKPNNYIKMGNFESCFSSTSRLSFR